MLSDKMQTMINDQIQREWYSAYIYLAMSAYYDEKKLPGFAHWMRLQCQEELDHAMKLFNYINTRNGRVMLKAIDAPPKEWASPLAAMQAALAHEQLVTRHVNEIMNEARDSRDNATFNLMQWYVDEQVEEEANVQHIIDQMEMIGDAPAATIMLDRALAGRAPTPTAQ